MVLALQISIFINRSAKATKYVESPLLLEITSASEGAQGVVLVTVVGLTQAQQQVAFEKRMEQRGTGVQTHKL